ncbi:hypothetical protein IMG5_060380 [Ichthyophthirius multifiliis]|uniref:Uncharacterized protein n=1 Tax=Ichthyophthirius multifiliis TaxID=5932 RepID=G0QNN5_ICHMU|nr:hypothetical protein IMG5_060380 [Ichthyophthirius multifiliis]EGR33172.1 hypothetical protein IMG5_060380 [Ichthyophthirius multifiliis]|eukprot:XP_004037158.1 hypothetical protein IMG5_060380 [Ichthyophthirius multifiliis]
MVQLKTNYKYIILNKLILQTIQPKNIKNFSYQCKIGQIMQNLFNIGQILEAQSQPQMLLINQLILVMQWMLQSHIKFGLEFLHKVFDIHKDVIFIYLLKFIFVILKEIINIKIFNVLGKIDLSREERVNKYNNLIECLKQIYSLQRIKKIALKKPNEQVNNINKYLIFFVQQIYFQQKIDRITIINNTQ